MSTDRATEGEVLILGCGYTGSYVARQLLAQGTRVLATTRTPARLEPLRAAGAVVQALDLDDPTSLSRLRHALAPNVRVVHSVPLVQQGEQLIDPTPQLLAALDGRMARLVYLSTTGVYGSTANVDERTPPAPLTQRQQLRLAAEQAVAAAPCAALILRPAAIYGPGRGVHAAMRAGRYRLVNDGSQWMSRIHVADLASHVTAALFGDLSGAYPVADAEPCSAREVAAFCAEILGLPLPPSIPAADAHETLRWGHRVDGSAIRRRLNVALAYPSYRVGIPASIAAERADAESAPV